MTPFQEGMLFLFCGARQDRLKALCWEGDGFVLLYKRIEWRPYEMAPDKG